MLAAEVDDSDDEEIDEDEAFNSDDERKYGAFFADQHQDDDDDGDGESAGSDEEDGTGESSDEGESSDDEEEGDGGQYMLDLLNNLDGDSKPSASSSNKANSGMAAPQHVQESPFAASVVPQAGLTLDSLLQDLQDTQGFGNMQKTMKSVATGQAVTAPASQVVSDRTLRRVNYKQQSRAMQEWQHAVTQNRHAETLDFRPQERLQVTRDVMVDTFVPTTDFERQIHAALQEAGQHDEQAVLQQEEAALRDDLGGHEISLEEYKQRHGQLAKMRALLFYHEQKRHHMNKIKSKTYRRIRKRQRERQAEAEAAPTTPHWRSSCKKRKSSSA